MVPPAVDEADGDPSRSCATPEPRSVGLIAPREKSRRER